MLEGRVVKTVDISYRDCYLVSGSRFELQYALQRVTCCVNPP